MAFVLQLSASVSFLSKFKIRLNLKLFLDAFIIDSAEYKL